MADLLIEGGVVQFLNGAPLFGPDYSCCCPEPFCEFCTGGNFVDCELSGEYIGTNGPCGGAVSDTFVATALAQWTEIGGSSFFSWNVSFQNATGRLTLAGQYQFFGLADCDDPVGVWSFGTLGNLFQFTETSIDPPGGTQCTGVNATVTISRSGEGYLFTVSGMERNPPWAGGACPGCAGLDGAYLAD